MPNLYVARRPQRIGLHIPMGKTQDLMFFLPKNRKEQLDRSELDELIRANLAKLGVTNEAELQAIIDKAETDYEMRIKVAEAAREVRRLMKLRAEGAKLKSIGFRKWAPASYRSIARKEQGKSTQQ